MSGHVAGERRTESGPLYVEMFGAILDADVRRRLHLFIHETLQSAMDARVNLV